jgi:hypothetical protein
MLGRYTCMDRLKWRAPLIYHALIRLKCLIRKKITVRHPFYPRVAFQPPPSTSWTPSPFFPCCHHLFLLSSLACSLAGRLSIPHCATLPRGIGGIHPPDRMAKTRKRLLRQTQILAFVIHLGTPCRWWPTTSTTTYLAWNFQARHKFLLLWAELRWHIYGLVVLLWDNVFANHSFIYFFVVHGEIFSRQI